MTIGILDAGMGNIGSIQRMISKVGGKSTFLSSKKELFSASKIILPGVGHFDEGIRSLARCGLVEPLMSAARSGTPILGICLGMQLLCRTSEEGDERGLGLVDGNVKKFNFPDETHLKIPHMGWNNVTVARPNSLILAEERDLRFYFVHSYYVELDDPSLVIATAFHGREFCAAFQKDAIFGAQFHPEKSHKFGMALMKRFWEI
ncbi:imidazole glycerol phosphate synthase subunit HisH [Thalassospira sp. SN3W]|uniref:imidazole glycerol phosphate synthase subunit HisH n=1 Tax=Thalassospira sp. SN3W TaxID=3035476 RepID=UPI00311B317C